jgi:hypothetical protein
MQSHLGAIQDFPRFFVRLAEYWFCNERKAESYGELRACDNGH